MLRGWQFAALTTVTTLILLLSACKGNNNLIGGESEGGERAANLENPYPPCTDPELCCPPESVVILGSPDDEQHVCLTLWTCDDPSRPFKCWSALPVPSGATNWECEWGETAYVCKGTTKAGEGPFGSGSGGTGGGTGGPGDNPGSSGGGTGTGTGGTGSGGGGTGGGTSNNPGAVGWDCVEQQNGENVNWTCTYKYPPNPGNNPGGATFYECVPNGENDRLECDQKPGAGQPGGSTSGGDNPGGGDNPPGSSGNPGQPSGPEFGPWEKSEQDGKTVWKRTGAAPLTDAICTRESTSGGMTLVCFGGSSNPSGQTGWECDKSAEFGNQICKTPLTGDHRPPGMTNGVCTDIVEMGRIVQICEESAQPPNAMPKPGSACIPRTRRWCDGVTFCGWGITECKDDGTWPTIRRNGREIDDCKEHPEGLRPNTTCARYYWFFNPECCERTDCIIPDGTNGAAYGPSEGNLCDPCSPQNPECKEPGALCVYLKKYIPRELIGGQTFPTGETYCGQECGGDRQCPDGYTCARACAVNFSGSPRCGMQCVPEKDGSCYLRTQQ